MRRSQKNGQEKRKTITLHLTMIVPLLLLPLPVLARLNRLLVPVHPHHHLLQGHLIIAIRSLRPQDAASVEETIKRLIVRTGLSMLHSVTIALAIITLKIALAARF